MTMVSVVVVVMVLVVIVGLAGVFVFVQWMWSAAVLSSPPARSHFLFTMTNLRWVPLRVGAGAGASVW